MSALDERAEPTPPSHADVGAPTGDRLRLLHPGWFAAVMGTGILAVSTYENPGGLDALSPVAQAAGSVLALLTYVLLIVLTTAFVARWVRHRAAAVSDLRHPVLGAMYGTVPGGLLVAAVMTSVIGPTLFGSDGSLAVVATLTVIGGLLGFAIAVAFTCVLLVGDIEPGHVTAGWFIPPVVTILVPIPIAWLVPHVSPGSAGTWLAVGYGLFGTGLVLFLVVLSTVYSRLVLHPLPGAALAPTFWIGLGPVGAGALSVLALTRATAPTLGSGGDLVVVTGRLGATALWGFGVWWLVVATLLVVRYARTSGLPFSLGWWAFTFPQGAFTVATLTLARQWGSGLLEGFGVVLWVVLVGFWVTVAVRTVAGMRSGGVWRR